MIDSAPSSTTSAARDGVTVVLLLPEALGELDEARLRTSLTGASTPIRALVCLQDGKDASRVEAVARLGVETEILLGPSAVAPSSSAYMARALPGTLPKDLIE